MTTAITSAPAEAAVKPKRVRNPAPSLTAQLKAVKAELKATKTGMVTALDNLQSERERAESLERLAYPAPRPAPTGPESIIAALSAYRSANSVDPTTDGVILRLIARLVNLG